MRTLELSVSRQMLVAKNARISTSGWTLDSLTSSSQTFRAVDRIPAISSQLSEVIKNHERAGLPLVIEGFHRHEKWPTKMFTIEGFEEYSESRGICYASEQSPEYLILSHRYWRP